MNVVPDTHSRGLSGVWLLDLDVGGRVERYATEEVVVTSSTGETFRYRGGLTPLVRSLGAGQDQQGFEVDDSVTDWGELEARGESIEWARATLRWWYRTPAARLGGTADGQLLEQALLVMSGVVVSPEYGSPSAPTRLVATIDQRAAVRAQTYPDIDAVIDDVTWQNENGIRVVGANAVGTYYPTVIGYPGSGDGPWSEPFIAVPVPMVDCDGTGDTKFLLGFDQPIDAATVWIFDGDSADVYTAGQTEVLGEQLTVASGADLQGRAVSFANVNGTASNVVLPSEDHAYYAGFSNDTGYGGGVTWRGELLRGLGDVILWALERARVEVDYDQQEGQRTVLNRFKLDTYLAGTQDLERWVDTQLVPLFPLRRMRSGRGLWYRYDDWQATASQVVAWLDVEAGHLAPTTALQTIRGALYNRFTLEYAFNPLRGTYFQRRVLDAELPTLYTGRYIPSPACRASQNRYGVLEKPPVQTGLLWSNSTAALVLQAWAARDALPLRGRGYEGEQLDRFLPGDVVGISDARVGLVERLAIVDDVRVGGMIPEIDVVFLPRYARTTT